MNHHKVIVLTGCSRGLGRALTEEFMAAGHRVHGSARSTEIVDSLNQQYAGKGSFSALDVNDDTALALWCKRIIEQDGPPDIDNAGINHVSFPNPDGELRAKG